MAQEVIFAEQTLNGFALKADFGLYAYDIAPAPFSLVLGESYIVVWDGETFTCEAQDMSAIIEGGLALGNLASVGGAGNNEPFIIGWTQYGVTIFAIDNESAHSMAIYQDAGESYAPNDAVILSYSKSPVHYENVPKVWLTHPESTEEAPVLVPFTYGEAVENVPIALNLADGDQIVIADDGILVKSAVIKKPADLSPENVRYGKEIAGVTGEFLGDTEEVTVDLAMADGNQIITPSAEGKSISKVTITKPETLIPENIAKDIEIGGIVGTHEGGGGETEYVRDASDKPIRFYNPYGKVIYGYTRAEIQELTELPAGPSLGSLTFDAWTHTLEELQSTTYFADVGPMYKRDSKPVTVLVVTTEYASQSVTVKLKLYSSSGTVTVNWGDNSTSTTTYSSSGSTFTHTYTSIGTYIVTINSSLSNGGNYLLGYANTNVTYMYGVMGTSVSLTDGASYMGTTPDCALISILLANAPNVYINSVHASQRLKFISTYNSNTYYKAFAQCPALKVIANKNPLYISSHNVFLADVALKRISVSKMLNGAFRACDALEEVLFSGTSITEANINNKWSLLLTKENPPTISASSPVYGEKPIYVPDAAVDTYKAADGWSSVADYILPASQYPD